MSRLPRPSIRNSGIAVVALAVGAWPAHAAIRYVGTGATCTSPTDYASLADALSASLAAGDDEIRLTRTRTYTNVNLLLETYSAASAGELVIAGGYDDCDDTVPSGRIAVQASLDEADLHLFEIATSTIVFRDLELRSAGLRGLAIGAGSDVSLENVWIHDCGGGASVSTGGALTIDAASSISDNETSSNGGGVACTGSGSEVHLYGSLERNVAALDGGNLWLNDSCVAELFPGSEVIGFGGSLTHVNATRGGGIFLDHAAVHALGGGEPVTIRDNASSEDGGGIFALHGTVLLENTRIERNYAAQLGGGIRAEQGGIFVMRRNGACPDPLDCSVLADNELGGGQGIAFSADDAFVVVENTMVRGNGAAATDGALRSLIAAESSTVMRLDGVGVVGNQAAALFTAGSSTLVAYQVTATLNAQFVSGTPVPPFGLTSTASTTGIANSIFDGTRGFKQALGGSLTLTCVLVDAATEVPAGSDTYFGTALFVDAAARDIRQLAGSPSIDMCGSAYVPPAVGWDLELQPRGFDSPGNPNGSPGVAGGLVDAGFDEYFPDNLIFADGFLTGDTSRWSVVSP